MMPSLGWINMTEQLRELRETRDLLEHWFIIEGNNAGTARPKGCIEGGKGKRGAPPCPRGVRHPPRLP